MKHGVDLFGRDTLALSRLVAVLGTFAECCAGSPAALPVCSAVLELLASPQVRGAGDRRPGLGLGWGGARCSTCICVLFSKSGRGACGAYGLKRAK